MTSERAQAYGRVMKTLSDLGPTKFHPDEQDVIREAVDTLFFSESDTDDGQRAIAAVHSLLDELVRSDRLLPETATRLLADIERCGPLALA